MNPKIHIGNEILKILNVQKRSISWLAYEIDYDQSNLNKQLKNPNINTEMLQRISAVLGVDFFEYFSQSLLKKNIFW